MDDHNFTLGVVGPALTLETVVQHVGLPNTRELYLRL